MKMWNTMTSSYHSKQGSHISLLRKTRTFSITSLCLGKAKVSIVNSNWTKFLVEAQRSHENIKWTIWELSCWSAFLYENVSFIEELRHLRFSMVQKFLSRLLRIMSRQYLFIWSGKSFHPLKLSTSCPQEKSNHKKNHAYLTDSEYSTCFLKKHSCLKHLASSFC